MIKKSFIFCSTRRRFEVLCALRDEGIPTIVWLTPILPFINDTEENIRNLLFYCACAGVKGIISFGMGVTLREGDREYFYEKLDESFPGVKRRYVQAFGNAYECPSPNSDNLMSVFRRECASNGIMCDPREIFEYLSQFDSRDTGQQLSLF